VLKEIGHGTFLYAAGELVFYLSKSLFFADSIDDEIESWN